MGFGICRTTEEAKAFTVQAARQFVQTVGRLEMRPRVSKLRRKAIDYVVFNPRLFNSSIVHSYSRIIWSTTSPERRLSGNTSQVYVSISK